MAEEHPTLAGFDLEVFQVRLRELADSAVRVQLSTMAQAAIACTVQAQKIDLTGLEKQAGSVPAARLWGQVEHDVGEIWLAVEKLQELLQPLIGTRPADTEWQEDGQGGSSPPEASADPPAAGPSKPASDILSRVADTAWALSFVLAGEVKTFRSRLPALLRLQDGWELVDMVQEHVAHVIAAAGALLAGTLASLPSGGREVGRRGQDLEVLAARELRSRIFELRDGMLAIEAQLRSNAAATWQGPLEQARRAVRSFMFGPGFAWMRAGDKRSFLQLEKQLAEVLELWSPLRAEPARHAIDSWARYLEALQVINQRECLVVHDRQALEVVVTSMEQVVRLPAPEARDAIAAAVAALSSVQGRDAELDRLLAEALAPGTPLPAQQILARAKGVLARLKG